MSTVQQNDEKIKIHEKSISLSDLFWKIQNQTEYEFLFNDDDIKEFKKLKIDVEGEIEEVLTVILKGKGLIYEKNDKVFIVKKKVVKKIQKEKLLVTGTVVDEKGLPLPTVTVVVQGTMKGAATGTKGKYEIEVKKGDALRFTFVGYKTQIILINGKQKIDVQLYPSTENIAEVQVTGFGEQKKESVVSSITTVKTEQLESSSSDLTSNFAGNIAGLIGWQEGGMPGALTEDEANTKFYIRGITSFGENANIDPLILLDGIEVSKLDLARIDPDDIDTFNIMKDASATAMYGARGANGVIYVKTKKGKEGDMYTSFRYEKIYSTPTDEIEVVDPITWMRKYNEALTTRNPDAIPKYSVERINRTASGKYPDYIYPKVDWYDKMFKKGTVNDHYNLNVRGGSAKVQYFASLSYNSDQGILKTDKLNAFDVNIKNQQVGLRVNLNINLNKTAKLIISSGTTFDMNHGPASDARGIYQKAFQISGVDFPATFPADKTYNWPHILFGGDQQVENPYAEVQKGYSDRKRFASQNRFEFIQQLGKYLKGLEFRASASLSKKNYFSAIYSTEYATYALQDFNNTTGEHTLRALNPGTARRTLELEENSLQTISDSQLAYEVQMLHNANWGDHQTSAIFQMNALERDNNYPTNLQSSLPQRNLGYAGKFSYGYKNKYWIEASAGYNGSERFSKKNKMGLFPALGTAWIVSKENFMQSSKDWLSYLKLRASYGLVGNDGVLRKPRFVYLQQLGNRVGATLDGQRSSDSYPVIYNYGNKNTTWEISEQFNLGLETKLFGNLIDVHLDVYQEVRHNVYEYRNLIPSHTGFTNSPLADFGKVKSQGLDFEGKIQHAINNDFWFIVSGTFTYNKATYLKKEQAIGKPEWQNVIGSDISQKFGYIADGLFQTQQEIDNAPYQDGEVMPGDIRYRDINKDGKIDVNDATMIGNPTTPRIVYGFNTLVNYKGFELGLSFQGSGQRSFFIDPNAISPFTKGRALLKEIANSHWTPDNHANNPFWTRLSTENIAIHNPQENLYANRERRASTYFMKSGTFLRCRKIELAYSLNKDWLGKYGIKKCKVYARTNNPFIISDFKTWDVELGSNGFNYPIQKTYSMGINLSF